MGYIVKMPQMGMSMDEGTVVEWTLDEGDAVEADEVVAVVESEKASADVEAREDGVLRRIVVGEGGVVEPGTAIGIVADADEDLAEYESRIDADLGSHGGDGASDGSAGTASAGGDDAGTAAETPEDVQATPGARQLAAEEGVDLTAVEGSGPQGVVTEGDVATAAETAGGAADEGADEDGSADVKATPGAEQAAAELGVDLAGVEGTGPQGVVTEDDVESAAAGGGTGSVPAEGETTRTVAERRQLSGMQQTISDRLSESYREAVHVTLNRSFDTGAVQSTLAAAEEAGADVGLTDLLLKAVGSALETHPEFNAVFEDGEHRLISEVNVGVAVDIEEGLLTPVVGGVDERSAESVTEARRALTAKVQSGEYTMDDLSGGTFTVSNLGPLGVDSFDPVINPPEIAILGVGRIRDDGTMTLSLSFDHRVVNGADGARFLETLVGALEDENRLAAFFAADLGADSTVGAPGLTEPRELRIETESGYSGRYRSAFGDVAFDEPEEAGGSGSAPAPVDHLLGALGSCLSLSVRAMAQRDGVEVGAITTDVSGSPQEGALDAVEVELGIETDADDSAVERVVTKAERACYVHQALSEDLDVSLSWARA